MKKKITLILLLALVYNLGYAEENTRSLATDHRIKVVAFQNDNVVPVHANTFNTTQVVFGQNETIENIQNGDLDAWTVSVQKGLGNMLFLKPTMLGSDTNMTVVTNQHTYYFHLTSNKNPASDPRSTTYAVQFTYPNQQHQKMMKNVLFNKQQKKAIINSHTNPSQYNWSYSFNGARSIMPLHIFDDGRFTYMQLRAHQPVPAVFAVDNASGRESVVNYRRNGQYLVIQQVAPQFTLREGKFHVASVFNNNMIEKLRDEGQD